MGNWNKLNDRQKAALVSLGYNAGPYFISAREYGKKIKSAIENDDMELASDLIKNGPTTGASTGKFYGGLQRRRNEEAQIFLS
jgi:GH24 family phage-related lysozyme (muramidase)